MVDKITTIRVKESTVQELNKIKEYPRETNEETLIKLIKSEIKNDKEIDK